MSLEGIGLRPGFYSGQAIRYLDLNHCLGNTTCRINRLETPLNPLLRYEFFFNDGGPVIGQNPVFNTPQPGEAHSPFRRVVRVIVPDGYEPNTIRSAQDVAASQFVTEDTARVENNPLVVQGTPLIPLTQGRAWVQNQELAYLELGSVPYASDRNQLGVGVVYFLRNGDKTDLPSQPRPIFDTTPGDLLYSPIRQVFRAVAEDQITNLSEDPSVNIRSQDELLAAVNAGVFRLEDAQDFFNYPVYLGSPETTGNVIELSLNGAQNWPALPAGANYALWVTNQLNEARLLLRFQAEGSQLRTLDGTLLETGAGGERIFGFSTSEVSGFRHFLVTIESEDVKQPTGSTLLEARYTNREDTDLQPSFTASYSALQTGHFILAAPTAADDSAHSSGIWFVQRTDADTSSLPLPRHLDPGLILSRPPRGWVYNGWVLSDLRTRLWLQTGRFQAINAADQFNRYQGNDTPFAFPGEDFLRNAPQSLFFPLNLPSTGERQVVVSLEPENLSLDQPFFTLYQKVIDRATPELTNQDISPSPPRFPLLRLRLRNPGNR